MRYASIGSALLALVTGIVAASYWFLSSKINIEPIWPTGPNGPVEPGEHEDSQDGWIGGALTAFSESARLNAKAAMWTAASVIFAAVASILSVLWDFGEKIDGRSSCQGRADRLFCSAEEFC